MKKQALETDFERGAIKTWDEKKDRWRVIMPTPEMLRTIKKIFEYAAQWRMCLHQTICRSSTANLGTGNFETDWVLCLACVEE
ncbi:MAG: hypothetical protein HY868_16625 [Chloroflexi bacterium]|nr:hypothetical protein [Chloroflexota bacterium]